MRARDAIGEVARVTGATFVVTGSIHLVNDSLMIVPQIVDASRRRVVGAPEPVRVSRTEAMNGIDRIRQHVAASLATVLDEQLSNWAQVASNPPTWEAYSEFIAGLNAYLRQRDGVSAVRHFDRAAAADSTYYAPLLWSIDVLSRGPRDERRLDSALRRAGRFRSRMAPADGLLFDRLHAVLEDDRDAAYRASHALAELMPRSHFVQMLAVDALAANHIRESVDVLLQLDPDWRWVQQWEDYWSTLAYALHGLGDYRRQLTVARRARQSRPELISFAWLEVQALAALGRVDAVDRIVTQIEGSMLPGSSAQAGAWNPAALMRNVALELKAHGHPADARRMLLRAEAWAAGEPTVVQAEPGAQFRRMQRLEELERWAAASAVAESLTGAQAWSDYAHGAIGRAAARLGDSVRARREIDILTRVSGGRRSPERWYHAATVAADLGERDHAVEMLRHAYAGGRAHTFWDHLAPDLEPLRNLAPYREIMRLRE
jgi:hypothetical protein